MDKVFVSRFSSGALDTTVESALDWLNWETIVPSNARVFVKPNFTYPSYKEGVTTSPAMIEAVVRALSARTNRITLCESDGGASAWSAEAAFAGHSLPDICNRYGASTMSLTNVPKEMVNVDLGGRSVEVCLPAPLIHDAEVFVSLPVPKVHAMTGVSLGFKNQWGCIPDVKRLRNHPQFTPYVLAINKILNPALVLFDGTYFLDRRGPMEGSPVRADLLVAADSPGGGTAACASLMGIDPSSIAHLKEAIRLGMMPDTAEELESNADLADFKLEPFTLERSPLNWVALYAFHSRLATWLLYNSRFAGPIHRALYWIRKPPAEISPYW